MLKKGQLVGLVDGLNKVGELTIRCATDNGDIVSNGNSAGPLVQSWR
jgi:hypothetical protein